MTHGYRTVLGIDLGGTHVKAGVVDADGQVRSTSTRPSGERAGRDAWVAAGIEAAREALAGTNARPVAVGLSVPGAVDAAATRLLDLVDRLPDSRGIDLAAAFDALALPVHADNDAKAALEAELRWGGHNPNEDIVILTLGTGIGGAALIGGRAPGGDPVLAGNQLGHLTVELDGVRCVCGNTGCAETVASGTAVLDAARRAGLEVADVGEVIAAEHKGDARAASVIDRFLDGLVATVVNAIHAYQPSVVVLAGGLMASADRILPPVQVAVAERAWTLPRGRVRVESSILGPASGVMAGAAVALDQKTSDRAADRCAT